VAKTAVHSDTTGLSEAFEDLLGELDAMTVEWVTQIRKQKGTKGSWSEGQAESMEKAVIRARRRFHYMQHRLPFILEYLKREREWSNTQSSDRAISTVVEDELAGWASAHKGAKTPTRKNAKQFVMEARRQLAGLAEKTREALNDLGTHRWKRKPFNALLAVVLELDAVMEKALEKSVAVPESQGSKSAGKKAKKRIEDVLP